jgi:hypothetical protein
MSRELLFLNSWMRLQDGDAVTLQKYSTYVISVNLKDWQRVMKRDLEARCKGGEPEYAGLERL